jgi:hypothetical protein
LPLERNLLVLVSFKSKKVIDLFEGTRKPAGCSKVLEILHYIISLLDFSMRLFNQIIQIFVGTVLHIQPQCFSDGFGIAVMPIRRYFLRFVSDRFFSLFEELFGRFQVPRFREPYVVQPGSRLTSLPASPLRTVRDTPRITRLKRITYNPSIILITHLLSTLHSCEVVDGNTDVLVGDYHSYFCHPVLVVFYDAGVTLLR